MKYSLTAICILVISCFTSAQTYQQHFQLYPVKQKIKNSLYKRIYLYDARTDTSNLGELQLGTKSNFVLVAKPVLRIQLQNLVDSLIDSSAANADLLFHIRQLRLSESAGVFREKGYFSMRAAIYARISGGYQKLSIIDTFLTVKSSEAAVALIKKVSFVITDFVKQTLSKRPSDTTHYTAVEIKNMEQLEKNHTPLYSNKILNDGIYKTYKSFMAQQPDAKVIATLHTNELKSIRVLDTAGKTTVAYPNEIYAVVYEGKPFISTEAGFCYTERKGSDFYFVAKIIPVATQAEITRAQVWFGLTGALIAADKKGLYEIQLDHYNGRFIPVKRIRALEDAR